MIDEKEFKARQAKDRDICFESWMKSPLVRMGISMIPASDENKDALMTLLRTAFECGFDSGSASVALTLMSGLIDREGR